MISSKTFDKNILKYVTSTFLSSTLPIEMHTLLDNNVSPDNQDGEFANNTKIEEFEKYVNGTYNYKISTKANEILINSLTSEMRTLDDHPDINPENTVLIHCHGSINTNLYLLPPNNRLITYQPIGNPGYSTHAKHLILHSKRINPLLYLEDKTHTTKSHFKGYTRPHIWEPNEEGNRVFNFDYELNFTLNRTGTMRQFGFYTCLDEDREMKLSHEVMDKIENWNEKNLNVKFEVGDILIKKELVTDPESLEYKRSVWKINKINEKKKNNSCSN